MRFTRLTSGVAVAACLTTLAACGADSSGTAGGSDDASGGKVALLIPGTTGDGGFFDDAKAGAQAGARKAGMEAQIIEAGYEPSKWQPALDDLVAGDADLIITGTFAMTELIEQAAAQFPDKEFVLFDSAVDPENCGGCTNVYSITYRYDQAGFLAGALAGLLETAKDVDKVESTGVVGVVGGQEIGVIEDYIAGFEAGVEAVAPDVKVLSAYANSFSDPVRGKAVAEDMISQGAEILFTAAGGTDQGVFEAAAAHQIWAIGNSDQQALNPAVGGEDTILTTASTDTASSIESAVVQASEGELPVGTVRAFGVSDGSVELTRSDLYTSKVPEAVQAEMDTISEALSDGEYDSVLTGG